ncbi:MAG: S8 family serine peptidase, partial [Ignavibacteria bacterium]|nr:S8 family serine peptidase [Ignavibacteria bacterium]
MKTLLFLIIFLTLNLRDTSREVIISKSYAEDHFIVKLKFNPFLASLNSNFIYQKVIYEIASCNNITVQRIKRIFPPDRKNQTDLYLKFELETYFLVYTDYRSDIPEICRKFADNDMVDFAEPDYIGEAAGKTNPVKPNDEFFKRQWALYNDGTIKTTSGKPGKKGADMNVLKGWEIEKGSEEIIVAILDSGVKTDHPDLKNRLWVNKDEIKNGIDDDGNGFVDDIYGYNFAYDNSNVRDDGGHGTNIAGTIGAETNNTIGYAGIDQRCKLMICKNLDNENTGEYSWWAASLYYAANNGARVINMSEGGYDFSRTLATAVKFAQEKGCLIVASMMNKNNSDPYYPVALPDVLAVGATDT